MARFMTRSKPAYLTSSSPPHALARVLGAAALAVLLPGLGVAVGGASLILVGTAAQAHGSKAGEISIEHPYATPTPPAARVGGVYFRVIENRGKSPDRLIGGRTPLADSVEIHRSDMTDGVMRMRALDALDLPPGAKLQLRHGGEGVHLMLVGLRKPLVVGDKFALTLRFEKAGEREVDVWVQQPRDAAPAHDHSAPAAHQH
jgi:copper(I)-binding protein